MPELTDNEFLEDELDEWGDPADTGIVHCRRCGEPNDERETNCHICHYPLDSRRDVSR